MSFNENIFNQILLLNGDMSTNLTTDVIDTSRLNAVVFFAKYTGAPVGSLKLQVSVDNVNFVDLPDSPQAVSAAGQFMWNVTDTNYDKIRLVYTRTSGTGTLNVQVNAKGPSV